MDNLKRLVCTICGDRRLGRARWFLAAEDRWRDKLIILHWDDSLATRTGIHCACSPAHLQQLVVHWMATGSLDHPFAKPPAKEAESVPAPGKLELAKDRFRASRARQIGELSVHRESMQRVLTESPQSLQTILDALLSALQRESQPPEPKIDWEDEALRTQAREV